MSAYFAEEGQAEPWSVSEDINGDGVVDWAGILRNNEQHLALVVVYANDEGFAHKVLTSLGPDQHGIIFGVALQPVGEVHGSPVDDADPDQLVVLSSPGIHLIYYEESSMLYYWSQGAFLEFWTRD